ncbi:MAG: class I SAM-dependent methyltransferase [Chloroflexota bacterium]|nr:class I SAM-dependent methyltransferase [Chloroflexota bacterium]
MTKHRRPVAASRPSVGAFGKYLPATTSALRPAPLVELAHWGGPALVKGKRVLDLGCGDGRLALGVAPYAKSVVGVDPDAEMIADATERARAAGLRNVRFVVGAGQELSFDDGSFDVVISSWAL